jgi:hypothetical protein
MEPINSWKATLVSLLPLWLLSIAIMVEGFPRPPISYELAVTAFILAITIIVILLWKWPLSFPLLLYYLFSPLILLYIFDEVSTSYKSLFILLCAFILSIGIFGYQRNTSFGSGVLILVLIGFATIVLALHASQNYWQMVGDLGYRNCIPDASGCAPLTGKETPWWILFIRF